MPAVIIDNEYIMTTDEDGDQVKDRTGCAVAFLVIVLVVSIALYFGLS